MVEGLDIQGPARSAFKVEVAGSQAHIIVRADTIEVRGLGAKAGAGSRWASAGVLTSIGRLEIDSLLSRLLLD